MTNRGRAKKGDCGRFLAEVTSRFARGCVEWPYSRSRKGYGCVRFKGEMTLAHRAVCELAHGEAPSIYHEAAHRCGNRLCCNPSHLRWATPVENAADKLVHGTHSQGEQNGNAKLTAKQVAEIRSMRGLAPQKQIASLYGVKQNNVSRIQTGVRWGS